MSFHSIADLISAENEVSRCYIFWTAILLFKMLLMAPLTAIQRFKTNTFANPEDVYRRNIKVKFGNEDVERVRRAHRNDLENIIPLVLIGFFYVLTNPSETLARNLFRIAAISRIIYTVVYAVWVVPMPTRGVAFFVSIMITAFMLIQTMIYFH